MSAPSRGRGGGAPQGHSTNSARGRGTNRGTFSNTSRGRGRGRGSAASGEGLLQRMRTGTLQRNSEDGGQSTRGRGTTTVRGQPNATRARASLNKTSNPPTKASSGPSSRMSSPAPVPTSNRDFVAQMSEKYNLLKPRRDAERKKAIEDGYLADPNKKTSLDKAITPVGTCTELCPEFERVERIVQNMVDKAEKIPNEASGRDIPSEERMVKRFRRSAAGYDEQLPSDIRTPETLKRTLDYLLDKVVGGGERLASIHKFVWDRTRGIRNDFSIQQVSKLEDVSIAVECYERIARFHILSLHQLSNPDNLQEGEHFEPQQEREQLNNTLLSLMYYYDDHRKELPFTNEDEFRAYCILFELQSLHPDLEERMQSWPRDLLSSPRVQTAFKIYAAAGNTVFDQGPLRPYSPYSIAQADSGKFWTILASQAVSYMMACVAEMHFNQVRFTALDALWRSAKSAPQGQQARNQDWTLGELTNYLGFDDEEQTLDFVQEFDLQFAATDSGEQYLDFTASNSSTLNKSSIPSQQIFSHGIVEEKRHRRSLVAVMNGLNVATAIRKGLVDETPPDDIEMETQDVSEDEQSLFIPEQSMKQTTRSSLSSNSELNPQASAFTPTFGNLATQTQQPEQKPTFSSVFGSNNTALAPKSAFGTPLPALASQAAPPNVFTPVSASLGIGSTGNPANDNKFPLTQAPISNIFRGFGSAPDPAAHTPSSVPSSTQSVFNTTQVLAPSHAQSALGNPGAFPSNSLFPFNRSTPTQSEPVVPSTTNAFTTPESGSLSTKPPEQQTSASEGAKQGQLVTATPSQPLFNFQSPPSAGPSTLSSQAVQLQPPSQQRVPTFSFSPSGTTQSDVNPNPSLPSVQGTTSSQSREPLQRTPLFFPQATTQNTSTAQSISPPSPPSTDNTPKVLTKQFQFPKFGDTTNSTTLQGSPKQKVAELNAHLGKNISVSLSTPSNLNVPPTISSATTSVIHPLQSVQEPNIPTASPVQKSLSKIDRERITKEAARLVLVQPQGLLDYFIGNHISSVLQKVVKEYQNTEYNRVMTFVRTRFLSRKFYSLWKNITQRNVLTRRAKQRRKLLSVAMQAEQQKKRRKEDELEAIIAATQETQRIKEQQRLLKEEAEQRRIEDLRARRNQDIRAGQLAGMKRKSQNGTENDRSLPSTPSTNAISHKRSRTMDNSLGSSDFVRDLPCHNTVFRTSTASSRFAQSFFGRSINSQSSQRSTSGHKVDNTRTDYFKLKAMGIDPDTPLVPDTVQTLAQRRRKQQEDRQNLTSKIRRRHESTSVSPSSAAKFAHMQPSKSVTQAGMQGYSTEPIPAETIKAAKESTDEDDFLKQLREAREAMTKDAEWFKTQTVELEKEIGQQVAAKTSQADPRSRFNSAQSPQTSSSGLARSNGHDYVPADTEPGKSLSRTEQRIRRTGAHGLANRPIGSNASKYVPVAMSRQSALRYSSSSHSQSEQLEFQDAEETQSGKKRSWNGSHQQYNSSNQTEAIVEPPPTVKRNRGKESDQTHKTSRTTASHYQRSNPFAALNDIVTSETDEEEGEEQQPHQNGSKHDAEEVYDEDEDEDLIEEIEEEAEHADDDGDEEEEDEDEDDDEEEEEEEEEEDDPDDGTDEPRPNGYSYSEKLPLEERVYGEYRDGDHIEGYGYGSSAGFGYPTISRGTSASATGSQGQNGPGASADDAFVLSD